MIRDTYTGLALSWGHTDDELAPYQTFLFRMLGLHKVKVNSCNSGEKNYIPEPSLLFSVLVLNFWSPGWFNYFEICFTTSCLLAARRLSLLRATCAAATTVLWRFSRSGQRTFAAKIRNDRTRWNSNTKNRARALKREDSDLNHDLIGCTIYTNR